MTHGELANQLTKAAAGAVVVGLLLLILYGVWEGLMYVL